MTLSVGSVNDSNSPFLNTNTPITGFIGTLLTICRTGYSLIAAGWRHGLERESALISLSTRPGARDTSASTGVVRQLQLCRRTDEK